MELTAETFAGMNRHIDFGQQVTLQAALGDTRMGLLPGAPFNNEGVFVRNTFEMEHFRCRALLPSGRVIDAEESAVVTIPMLFGNVYYLTVGFSTELTEFEKEGVRYVRPQYEYRVSTLEEVEKGDLMPVVRFKAEEGVFSVDTDYIPPTLQLVCDLRFKDYIESYAERLEAIARHEHLTDEFGKRAILHYLFLLQSYNRRSLTADFVQLTQEIAQAIGYYIMSLIPGAKEESDEEIPECTRYDVESWLKWLEGYMKSALSVLDGVVPNDHTIDFDELKAQIKGELYGTMVPELHDNLLAELQEEWRTEREKQEDEQKKFKEEVMTLLARLREEIPPDLYKRLYNSLYSALWETIDIHKEEEEENSFVPMI